MQEPIEKRTRYISDFKLIKPIKLPWISRWFQGKEMNVIGFYVAMLDQFRAMGYTDKEIRKAMHPKALKEFQHFISRAERLPNIPVDEIPEGKEVTYMQPIDGAG